MPPGRSEGAVAEGGDLATTREKKVPQPLLPSLFLRDSWLLPGILETR